MQNQIIQLAENHVKDLLAKGLNSSHRYHSLDHTMSVRKATQVVGKQYRLTAEELELLEVAALFHDTGFTKIYNGHEEVSKELAEAFLTKSGYPADKIRQVKALIEVTKVGVEPKTMLEKIIKDADFSTYDASYEEKSVSLRHEWEVFNKSTMSDEEWLLNNISFWENHVFYTGEALALFGESKRKMLKKMRKKAEGKNEMDDLDFAIGNSKSAQMMFKTTLRNQIDLTNIADNKANIMLSINSLLITFGMPLLVSNLTEHPMLIYPGSVLLITCVLSIIYATSATRPVKMTGETDIGNLDQGTTNLFFFGNFYKMSRDDYRKGLRRVVKNEGILTNSIVNDLFFLGRTLGNKYHRLRITYIIFMVGMVLTVLTFAIAFWLEK